jgi:hypothetical protein
MLHWFKKLNANKIGKYSENEYKIFQIHIRLYKKIKIFLDTKIMFLTI